MMKSTIRTLFLLSALLFSACEKDDSIFTELSIRFVMPDSRPVESWKYARTSPTSTISTPESGCHFPPPNRTARQYGSAKGFTRSSSKPTRPIRPEKEDSALHGLQSDSSSNDLGRGQRIDRVVTKIDLTMMKALFCRYWRCCPPPLPPSAIRSAYWSVLPFSARRTNGP